MSSPISKLDCHTRASSCVVANGSHPGRTLEGGDVAHPFINRATELARLERRRCGTVGQRCVPGQHFTVTLSSRSRYDGHEIHADHAIGDVCDRGPDRLAVPEGDPTPHRALHHYP